ncbi:hypothetical protein GOP47_0016342 [Adiantum capillus-veneris]|uniref:RING-type E3 ubiquitin transferase n=1 Tax=Adiantum capillus-veneris TaxID=13818 RepID=A0A9D4UHW9_ADICA|nr:hypothetical protein GOP47_0016342 [Adiantum capillus-veneris]
MQILAEIKEEVDGDATMAEAPRFGIAINKGQSARQALKWALDKAIPPQALVCLLHVQTPLRSIPNGIGGKYPIENMSPETVRKYKEQLFQEMEKIMKECKFLSEKRKIRAEAYYIEHSTVQNGLVDQIYKLGITNLILGKSQQNALTRALKKDIPTSTSKHAPKFCTVMVVCKGKLYSIKDATQTHIMPSSTRSSNSAATDVSTSEISETSASSADTNQDEARTSGHIDEEERSLWSVVKDDDSNVRHSQSSSVDFSEGSNRFLLSQNGNGCGDESPAFPSMLRTHSSPTRGRSPESESATSYRQGRSPESESATSYHQGRSPESESATSYRQGRSPESESATNYRQPWSSPDYTNTQFSLSFNRSHASTPARDSQSANDNNPDASAEVQEFITPAEHPRGSGDSLSSVASIYMTMDDSEITLYPNFDGLSQINTDIERSTSLSISEGSSGQRPLQASEQRDVSSTMAFSNNEGQLASDFDFLLKEAKQSAGLAQREAQRQAINFRKTEEVIAFAKKMLAERDEALKEVSAATQKAATESKRYEEAIAVLKDQETLQKRIDEEAQKNQETRAELENLKRMIDNYAVEANFAKQQAEAERRRSEETLMKLEEVTKKLESESLLRKEAEEKASQEAIAKLDAVMALRKEQQKFSEYSFHELQTATNHFSEDNKLGEGGYGPVYKGKLYNTTVAIKVLARQGSEGHADFQKEVEFLSRIHHPHMVMLLGACPEKSCIVYEYMANGSLEDRLNCKDGTPPLPWYVRFRICLDVATALLFIHSRPQPIVHRNLKPGNILLDHHFVSKIGDAGLAKLVPNSLAMYKESTLVGTIAYIDPDYQRTGVVSRETDVYSLGIIMLQLLTGRPAIGVADLVEEAVDSGHIEDVLDKSAGDWPLSEAMVLACLSMQCAEPRRRHRPNLETKILPDLERIQSVAGMAAVSMGLTRLPSSKQKPIIPSFFFCPISQEIMESPHMAADGFTYEHDAVKAWLQGHDTSPMTNLTLSHKNLIPNHTLRATIKEWYENGLLS